VPRTVVYDQPFEQAHQKELLAGQPDGKPTRAVRKAAQARVAEGKVPTASKAELAALPTTDSYVSKIAKYVPAEMTAVMLAFFAAFTIEGNWIWLFLGLGAVINVIYLFSIAVVQPVTQRPRTYFYGLSVLAFMGWAIAVLEVVQGKVGIDSEVQEAFVLAATAFLIPALDTVFGRVSVKFG
jgi:hypothetical protein